MLEKTAICVEFCLELAHSSRKWLGSILMVSQEVCMEFFLKLIILKVLNKAWRSGGFETGLSLLYLWCININFSSAFMATTLSSILLCVSLPCSNFSQDSNNNAVLIIFYCYKLCHLQCLTKTLSHLPKTFSQCFDPPFLCQP